MPTYPGMTQTCECSLLKPDVMEQYLKSHGMSWLLKLLSYFPWMSSLSLLAKLPGVFLVILSLGHNTKTHGSKYMYLQTGPTWGYQFQWDGYGWIPHLDVIQILLHLRWTASRTRITPGQYCAIQKHHCHCLSEQDTQQKNMGNKKMTHST